MEDRQRQQDIQNAQMRSQSPEGQLIPVVGGVAGTVGGAYAINQITGGAKPAVAASPVQTAQPTVQATTPAQGFTQGAQTGSAAVTPAGNTIPAGSTIPSGYTAVGTSADGATIIAPTDQVNALPSEALNDPSFLSTVDWGQVAQGTLTVAQVYAAYKSYKSGDKVGAGIYGASAAGNLAAMAGSTTAASVVPGLNVAAGVYQGWKVADYQSDAAAGRQRDVNSTAGGAMAGASVGAAFGPIGMAIGAFVGAAAGYAGSKFGSGKGKAQFMRDGIRAELQKGGILDENWQGTLADGSSYDFGKDGSTLKWSELDKVASENKNAWDAAVPLGDALAVGYGFVGQKASDITGWYAKAAVSNAGNDPEVAKANMRHFARQQGITYEGIKQRLDEAKADGRITEAQYNYYLGGAQQLNEPAPQAPQGRAQAPAPKVPQAAPPAGAAPKAPLPPGAPAPGPVSVKAAAQAPRGKTPAPSSDPKDQSSDLTVMAKQLADRMNKRGR
jgi:hypothetical protein